MKKVALVVNVMKKGARDASAHVISLLRKRGALVIADRDTAELLNDRDIARNVKQLREEADLVVALGGDGTVLKAARLFAGAAIPLAGINLGGLGFLTAATFEGARDIVNAALDGACKEEQRMLLHVTLRRKKKTISTHIVLNDAVITKGLLSRLVRLDTFIGDHYLATFVLDGLIVSSPTGSTAYSLSAGGPLVSPDTDAIIITPVCPHTLTNRPLIVPGQRCVRLVVADEASDIALTLDGQVKEKLRYHDEVVVRRYDERLTLLFSPDKDYFNLLREKLNWGGRSLHA